jgi:riboflavin synthase alpha subunit
MLIQDTQDHVPLSKKSVGQLVNIEYDWLTKSVARTLVGSMSAMIDAAVAKALSFQKVLDSR